MAAESAAESADQAEAAADVAETAAELVVGRNGTEDGTLDPEAQAALDARVDAGGFEESYADRLASLLPAPASAPTASRRRPRSSCRASCPSPASRASSATSAGSSGVQSVAVASGPEGEFVFNVTHRARRLVPRRHPDDAGLRRPRHRHQRRHDRRDRARSRVGELIVVTAMAGTPAIALLLPPSERERVAEELRQGGLRPDHRPRPRRARGHPRDAPRRDVAVLDIVGDPDDGTHAAGRCSTSATGTSPRCSSWTTTTLDRLDFEAPGHENDEYLTRPYSAGVDPLAGRGDVHPLGRRRRRHRPGPPGRDRQRRVGPPRPAAPRVQPEGRRRQDDGRHQPRGRARHARASGSC